MEELDPREIGGLRSVIDTFVEDFPGIGDSYTGSEGQPHLTRQTERVEKSQLEVVLIQSGEEGEVRTSDGRTEPGIIVLDD